MTDQPAMPLDNKEAIAAINRSINFLISEFIRPTAQQTVANAEAISRTERIVESNARAIEANASAISDLKQSLELSVRLTDDVASEAADNEQRIEANESRFDTLIAELRRDRANSDQRFEEQKARDEADRAEWRAGFNAQQEIIQRLLLEIRSTNGAIAGLSDRVEGLEAS